MGEIGVEGQRTGSIAALRAAGVGCALLGLLDEGATRLERVCRLAPGDATAWNDVAAIRYEIAVARNEPQHLPAALSAVDHAIRLSPALAQARFNRALILTRLGIRPEALRAWSDVVAVEHDNAWKAEVAAHVRKLRSEPATPTQNELEHVVRAAEAADPAQLRALVAANPQDVRISSETVILAAWAAAVHNGRDQEATRLLVALSRIGQILAMDHGDHLLHDIVRTITSAPLVVRRQLADSHVAYRDARIGYAKRKPHSADELRSVAERFARLHSPMEFVARYYSANALLDSNRLDESRLALDRVLASIDARRYPSLAAGAEKELGLYYGFRGMWTASLTHLELARTLFTAQNETVNAVFTAATIGEAYDRIGDFQRGWRHRISALDVLTQKVSDHRCVSVLIGAVHAEIMRADYESALSLLQVVRRQAQQVAIPDVQAEMILREAQVLLIARSLSAANAALVEAKRISATIGSTAIRQRVDAEIAVVEASIVRRSDPGRAVGIITPAIKFFRSHDLGILLPAAYLERGRAHLASGARTAARDDFNAGLHWIEQQRANVHGDIRMTLFDTVPELSGELVDVLLTDGDTLGAYAAVERARARTLVEELGIAGASGNVDIPAIAAALPPNAAVIEYALLPDGAAAFCIRRNGLTVRRLTLHPAELRQRVTELRALIQERSSIDKIQQAAAQLYVLLIAPLEEMIGETGTLYIVPDRFLNATPFPALYDGRTKRYLIQKYRLLLSPSGSFLLRGERSHGGVQPALIIADPTSPAGGQRLDAARRSATDLAALFGAPPPLVGREATIERFIAIAPKSALIHYAGHANSNDTAGGFLPLAPSPGSDGRLDATAISRLPLGGTNLVVLSACATMRGDVSRVEGMPSVSRAFLNAHARAVIGMLWEIDDQPTARLLAPFYQHLREGMAPSLALQQAQIAMLNGTPDLRHPSYWAAAQFLGID